MRVATPRVISWGVLVSKVPFVGKGGARRVLLQLGSHEGSAEGTGRTQEHGNPSGARKLHTRGRGGPPGPGRRRQCRVQAGGRGPVARGPMAADREEVRPGARDRRVTSPDRVAVPGAGEGTGP